MTIRALIDKVKDEMPNSFSTDRLISFINDIEAECAHELHKYKVPVYTAEDLDKMLLVPPHYDRLYESYLKAHIARANEELQSFTNHIAQHSQDYQDFVDWIVRDGIIDDDRRVRRFRHVF